MRDKKDKELGFRIPDIRDEEIIKKENTKSIANIMTCIMAIVFAILASLVWKNLQVTDRSFAWRIGVVLGILGGILLPVWFKLARIDFSRVAPVTWISSGFFYFILFLGFFVVAVNPPFVDASGPAIEIEINPPVQEPNGEFLIIVNISDNSEIDRESVWVAIRNPLTNKTVEIPYEKENIIESTENLILLHYEMNSQKLREFDGAGGRYILEVGAKDIKGRSTEESSNFTFSKDVIKLIYPTPGQEITDPKMVEVELDNSVPVVKNAQGMVVSPKVFIEVVQGENVERIYLNENYEGTTARWPVGNLRVTAFAEICDKNGNVIATIRDSESYNYVRSA